MKNHFVCIHKLGRPDEIAAIFHVKITFLDLPVTVLRQAPYRTYIGKCLYVNEEVCHWRIHFEPKSSTYCNDFIKFPSYLCSCKSYKTLDALMDKHMVDLI